MINQLSNPMQYVGMPLLAARYKNLFGLFPSSTLPVFKGLPVLKILVENRIYLYFFIFSIRCQPMLATLFRRKPYGQITSLINGGKSPKYFVVGQRV